MIALRRSLGISRAHEERFCSSIFPGIFSGGEFSCHQEPELECLKDDGRLMKFETILCSTC